nr:unnamed protein product [Digitaria exilis]
MEDLRLCPFATPDGKLHTAPLYRLLLAAQETATHIMFECPFAAAFWHSLGFDVHGATTAALDRIHRART